MSTSSISSPSAVTSPQTTLTGSSTFAADLQTALNRAVSIASLPIQLLQADQSTVTSHATELGQLNTLFTTFQSALQGVASGASSGAQSVSVSNSSVATASLSGNALPGTYTINVSDPGSEASAISNATGTPVTDPSSQSISTSTSFTLSVGGTNYTIQPASQSLTALANAINSSGAGVQALVVNLGSPSSADYRLVVQNTSLGSTTIQLNDGSSDLLGVLNGGSNATYTVNGQPNGGISTNSSTVTIAPGLTATIQGAGSTTITIAASLNSVSSSLSSFVDAYNSVVSELQKNHGQNGGALTGDSTILSMESVLNQIINYSGSSGSITSLTQLGIEFQKDGTLTFDPSDISGLSQTQISDALSFLGDPNASGFLQFATNTLSSITDSTNGIIATEGQALQNQMQRDQDQINAVQARVTQLQTTLQAQMAKADALIATLQQQNTFLQGLFQYNTSNNPNATNAG